MQSLKTIWAEGGTALGAWMSLRDPIVAEVAGPAGFDYVCIDMQHGLTDYDDGHDAARDGPARRRCRSCACRGTSRGSSAGCSTPARWA